MSSRAFFRFPRTKFASENDLYKQLKHVRSENNEAIDAYVDNESAERIAEELIDQIGSAETALHILAEKEGVDIEKVAHKVKAKNFKRGYYTL